jgi:nucleotide-binding universal stress UspA family protein
MKAVLATDGSVSAHAAGALLATLPLPPDTRLQVVNVLPEAPAWSEIFAGELAETEALRRAESYVAGASVPFRERGIPVETMTRCGHAGNEIVQAAEQMDAELICVGSHGRTSWAATLIGSTAEYVAKRARCSVLVVRPVTTGIRRILLTTDGSEQARRAAEQLRDLPVPRTAPVTVLHVVESFFAFPGLAPSMREEFEKTVREIRGAQRQNGQLLVEGTCRLLEAAAYAATPELRTGHPAQEILAAAREGEVDLIVTGARGLSPTREFFLGSVSGRVLRYAPCSVLVAR